MEPSGPGRYRSLSAQPSPAAYVDGEGTILASNGAFDALREELLNGRSADPAVLPVLFVPEDRESVRQILTAGRPRVSRSFRSAAPAEAATSLSAEFVRIQRKSLGDVVWLVTLERTVEARGDTSELDVRAALTETIIEDLRIPLQEVLGWTSLLRRTRGDAKRTEQALATIERNAELVIRLLEGLVESARRQETRTPPTHPAHRVELGKAPRIDASHVI